jgi:excisionase family DNA binding protein
MLADGDCLLTTADLAAYLNVPVETVRAWRARGTGPPGFRMGRGMRYRRSKVDAWIEQLEREDREAVS